MPRRRLLRSGDDGHGGIDAVYVLEFARERQFFRGLIARAEIEHVGHAREIRRPNVYPGGGNVL